MDGYEIVDMKTEEGRSKVETYEREKEKAIKVGQQLYAKIKKSSKYYNQNNWCIQQPERFGAFPFAVRICPDFRDYCVQGGPGGQYRLADVNLFVIENGKELRIA